MLAETEGGDALDEGRWVFIKVPLLQFKTLKVICFRKGSTFKAILSPDSEQRHGPQSARECQ